MRLSVIPSFVNSTVRAANTPPRKRFHSIMLNDTQLNDSGLEDSVAVDMPRKKTPRLSLAGTSSSSSQQVEDAEARSDSNRFCEKIFSIQDSMSRNQPSIGIHQEVKEALNMFRETFGQFLKKYKAQHGRTNAGGKVQTDAAKFLRKKHKWINDTDRLGPTPGIEVGDRFYCRAELKVVGLHRQFIRGIDYMKMNGSLIATSIVASDRYANRRSDNSLRYIGQGGNPMFGVKPTDQKMECGNLALFNSMNAKTPVRVIFKVSTSSTNYTFVYDGLYQVDNMTQVRGEFGKLVFQFFLNRISGQPENLTPRKEDESKHFIAKNDVTCLNDNVLQPARVTARKTNKLKTHNAHKDVVCVNDVSQRQEEIPIRVVTSRNDGQKLPPFDYVIKIEYPNWFKQSILPGCDCIGNCLDDEKCSCVIKNGGIMPYDLTGKLIADGKSLFYECGPSCKCSASCINRVSQHGIKFKLEIFETDLKGWGVRTRSFIPARSFVCEYVGEVMSEKEAKLRLAADGYTFQLGMGKGFIDATRRGNIARFINHSCSPNLCVKDVLYDDMRFSHKMLFAMKDIPSGRELTYYHRKKEFQEMVPTESNRNGKLGHMSESIMTPKNPQRKSMQDQLTPHCRLFDMYAL